MNLSPVGRIATALPIVLAASVEADDEFLPYGYESADPAVVDHSESGGSDAGSDWTDLSWDLSMLWQNRYVTEGRRRVRDAHFLMTDAVVHLGPLNLGAWWAQALTQSSYNQLDVYADTSFRFDAGKLSMDLRRVFYPTGKEDHSWEAGLGFDFNTGSWFTPFLRTYYDFDDIGGGFFEAGVKAPITLFNNNLQIMPVALLGVDYGYVDQGDNRPQLNNLQFGAELRWDVNPRWQIHGNLNHSLSLSGLDDIEESDVTWGGTGVRFKF
jgi:hypothetical protein